MPREPGEGGIRHPGGGLFLAHLTGGRVTFTAADKGLGQRDAVSGGWSALLGKTWGSGQSTHSVHSREGGEGRALLPEKSGPSSSCPGSLLTPPMHPHSKLTNHGTHIIITLFIIFVRFFIRYLAL